MAMEDTLRRWVGEHKVCWEIGPLVELDQHPGKTPVRVQVGFELRLFARHSEGVQADPACRECTSLFERLRALAVFTLPKEHRPTRYEIAPFDNSFHMRPESQWVPEVQLTLRLIHEHGYLEPVDDCEKRCAEEIQGRLRALGAQPKAWPKGLAPRPVPDVPVPGESGREGR